MRWAQPVRWAGRVVVVGGVQVGIGAKWEKADFSRAGSSANFLESCRLLAVTGQSLDLRQGVERVTF